MRLICNRTQNDAIWVLIALLLTNQIAGNTIDFKMNVIKHEIVKKGEDSQAQTLLDEINDWSMANKFHLHPQKCKELRISFTRDDVSYEDASIDQTTLNTVESVKILGVIIQNNLK